MKKIRLLTLLALGMFVGTTYAQSRVSGVVKSSEDGQPLAGVTVRVKGTNIGAATGPDGSYTINNAPANATLEFMYAGMRTQSVSVSGKSTLNTTLAPDALQAEAVTVTALGGVKQDRKLGYATSTVKGDALSRTNSISPINALQGKVAGLNIQTSGSAGLTGAPQVTLRGAKSLTKNNSPIYVIDGIIMENPTALGENASIGGTGASMYGNQLKNLNMDDFESVTVLKGAAATSLYGSRGANGAIIMTSKSGKARKGIGVDVSYSHEFSQTYANALKLQNEYGMGSPGNGFEGGFAPGKLAGSESYSSTSFGPKLDGRPSQQYYKLWANNNNPVEPFVAHPDNWKALFQTGQSDNVGIALTGGTDKATFRLSYGYADTKGSLPNNSFKRHSVDLKVNGKINDVFSADLSVRYGNSNTLNAQSIGAYGGTNYVMLTTYYLSRNTDLKWYKDNYINPENWSRMPTGDNGSLQQLQGVLNGINDNNVNRNEQTIIARAQLTAQLTQWLDASAAVTYNHFDQNTETKNYGSGLYRAGGYYETSGNNNTSYEALIQLHSNNSFVDDNLTLDVRLMYELYGNAAGSSYWKRTRGGLITPGLFTFANSKEPLTVDDMSSSLDRRNSMTMGVAANVNLGWKDQIFLELTARNDWNSTLTYPSYVRGAANNYSVFYPSANASWVFSDTFQIDPKILSMGRLRASIAQVGSGTGVYDTASGTGGYNMSTITSPTGSAVYAASPNNTTLANLDLKPELQQTIEFGTDLRFLNGAIGIDVAYYKSNTYNQILQLGSVSESGASYRMINAGNIQNQGWEVQLDFRPIQTNKVRWEISFNWSRNRGKIVELHPDIKNYAFNSADAGAIPGIYGFEGGAFGQIVSGPGYGYGSASAYAKYYNKENPNDPRNGQRILRYNSAVKEDLAYQSQNTYRWVQGREITGYYGKPDPKTPNEGGATYWGEGKTHEYDVLGNIEPDFNFGATTTLSYAGFDLFVQIDGRMGGQIIAPDIRYAMSAGSLDNTLYGRDADHGGVKRINYKGETEYNGYVMDGIFGGGYANEVTSLKGGKVKLNGMTMQEAIDAGHIMAPLAGYTYQYNYGFNSSGLNNVVHDMSYISLREISLGYNFPEKWIKVIGMQSARLSFTARNLCYIYNGMPSGMNPESISSNNPLTPVSYGGVPFTRNFNLALKLRF